VLGKGQHAMFRRRPFASVRTPGSPTVKMLVTRAQWGDLSTLADAPNVETAGRQNSATGYSNQSEHPQ